MSGNGMYTRANDILHVNDAVEAAAYAANEAKHLVYRAKNMDREDLGMRQTLIEEAEPWAKVAAGLSAYVLMLSEVRP
jgi:hypothetical protein